MDVMKEIVSQPMSYPYKSRICFVHKNGLEDSRVRQYRIRVSFPYIGTFDCNLSRRQSPLQHFIHKQFSLRINEVKVFWELLLPVFPSTKMLGWL